MTKRRRVIVAVLSAASLGAMAVPAQAAATISCSISVTAAPDLPRNVALCAASTTYQG